MGLAASQARLLLLTAKNDALELQAQKIEQERLLLAQEQEVIASKYSEQTSNNVYVCSVMDAQGNTQSQTMDLESLAKSQAGAVGGDGCSVIIADANGNPIAEATASRKQDGTWDVKYQIAGPDKDTMIAADEKNSIIAQLRSGAANGPLQTGLQNGSYQLFIQDTSDGANSEGTSELFGEAWKNKTSAPTAFSYNDKYYVRKSPESLSGVTSRYYTEDDAAAQAEYTTALARVNALDTKLENKLNQVETQKKSVEKEMESVKSVKDSNIERTFSYFS